MASLARRLTRSSRELQEAELHKMIVAETALQIPPPNTQTSPPPRRATLRKGEPRWRYSVTITNPMMIGTAGEGASAVPSGSSQDDTKVPEAGKEEGPPKRRRAKSSAYEQGTLRKQLSEEGQLRRKETKQKRLSGRALLEAAAMSLPRLKRRESQGSLGSTRITPPATVRGAGDEFGSVPPAFAFLPPPQYAVDPSSGKPSSSAPLSPTSPPGSPQHASSKSAPTSPQISRHAPAAPGTPTRSAVAVPASPSAAEIGASSPKTPTSPASGQEATKPDQPAPPPAPAAPPAPPAAKVRAVPTIALPLHMVKLRKTENRTLLGLSPITPQNQQAEPPLTPLSQRPLPEVPLTPLSQRELPQPPLTPLSQRELPPEPPLTPLSQRELPPEPPLTPLSQRELPPEPPLTPLSQRELPPEPPLTPLSQRELPPEPPLTLLSQRELPPPPPNEEAPADGSASS